MGENGNEAKSLIKRSKAAKNALDDFRMAEPLHSSKRNRYVDQIPMVQGATKKDYDTLKGELIDVIINNRIYKEDELQDLFKRVTIVNTHMDRAKLLDI